MAPGVIRQLLPTRSPSVEVRHLPGIQAGCQSLNARTDDSATFEDMLMYACAQLCPIITIDIPAAAPNPENSRHWADLFGLAASASTGCVPVSHLVL
jgi:hypothetical protein